MFTLFIKYSAHNPENSLHHEDPIKYFTNLIYLSIFNPVMADVYWYDNGTEDKNKKPPTNYVDTTQNSAEETPMKDLEPEDIYL